MVKSSPTNRSECTEEMFLTSVACLLWVGCGSVSRHFSLGPRSIFEYCWLTRKRKKCGDAFPLAFHWPEEVIGRAQWPLEIYVEASSHQLKMSLELGGEVSDGEILNLKPGDWPRM